MAIGRLVSLIALSALAYHATAQTVPLLGDPSDRLERNWDNVVAVNGGLDYNANTLHNDLVWGLRQGSYLDRDLRERSRASLRTRNRAGFGLSASIDWLGADSLWGHARWRPLVHVAHHDVFGLRFTSDLFALTFFGNANYETRRADLGPSAFAQVRYQTAGFGIRDPRSASFLRVDLVLGQSYSEADVKWAGVYTGTDGRVIRASILADYLQSDTAGSSFGRNNGLGMALSGRWETKLDRSATPARFSVTVQDFGVVRWNDNAVRLSKDTIISFSGIEVADILDLGSLIIGEDQLLDTFGLRYRRGSFARLLPFQITGMLSAPLGDRWYGRIALDQRYLPGYIPQLLLSADRSVGTRTWLGAQVRMGGFGGLRLGLTVQKRFGDHLLATIHSPHVPGFLLGSTKGAGVMASVQYGF